MGTLISGGSERGGMATVLLARHGETTWNRDGRIQGWAPSSLTELGREQARALGAHLDVTYDLDRIFASDLRRVQETTAYVARAVGAAATYEPEWRERDFGCLQGLTVEELFEGYPQYSLAEVGYTAAEERPESGESLVDTRRRVLDRWERLLAEIGDGETVLVVAHSGPIHLLLGETKGLGIVATMLEQEAGNCALSELRAADGDVSVARENVTSFLTT